MNKFEIFSSHGHKVERSTPTLNNQSPQNISKICSVKWKSFLKGVISIIIFLDSLTEPWRAKIAWNNITVHLFQGYRQQSHLEQLYVCMSWLICNPALKFVTFLELGHGMLVNLLCETRYTRWDVRTLTHWGRDKMDAISQTTSSRTFSWMKMFEFRLKFQWILFLRVQ